MTEQELQHADQLYGLKLHERKNFGPDLSNSGDYYLTIIDDNDLSHSVRVSTSGGVAPLEVKLAVANLYRAMEKHGVNEP